VYYDRVKNVTITLDEETARRARVRAAERNVSLSRYLGELLQRDIRESDEYRDAMQRYFGSDLVIRRQPGERRPSRDELHDRGALREGEGPPP
jgi:hypothetical protein